MKAFVDLPTGVLFDGSVYKLHVEAGDGPNGDIVHPALGFALEGIPPATGDYNPNQLVTGFAVVNNLTDVGSPSLRFQALLNVSDPAIVRILLP